jgi:hypothetical protein
MPQKLEDVIAGNVLALRTERGWTQAFLGRLMRGAGMANWATNRVAQIETKRRPAHLIEVVVLAWVFQVPLERLLDGDGDVELPGAGTLPLATVRAILTGAVPSGDRIAEGIEVQATDELRRIAKKLGLSTHVLDWMAHSLYGRSFLMERDARVGDVTGQGKGSVNTKRGNVTRLMVAELAGIILAQGMERVQQGYQAATGG